MAVCKHCDQAGCEEDCEDDNEEEMKRCTSCGHEFEEDEEFMEMSESMLGIFAPKHFANMCMACYKELEDEDEDEDED